MYTWFSRSWIQSLSCYYRWPSVKCECVYTASRNIWWWQQNVHQGPRICWFCNKSVSIFRYNPSIEKHQKQFAKSKEIFVSVISVWSVSWRNPCSRRLHIMAHVSWSEWKRRNLQTHRRKARKITYQVTHLGNNKQAVLLTLAIFQENTTAAIKSYFRNRLDAANFLTLLYKVFVICNSKQRFNTSNHLGNAAVQGDHI